MESPMTYDVAPANAAPVVVLEPRPRERLLEAASQLFCRYGINGVVCCPSYKSIGTYEECL